jgi:hypothetical protein
MAKHVQILDFEKDGGDGLIVTFSDGTIGGYVVEELQALRPLREEVPKTKVKNLPQTPGTQPP